METQIDAVTRRLEGPVQGGAAEAVGEPEGKADAPRDAEAVPAPGLGLDVPRASRGELAAILGVTVALHVLAVDRLARAHEATPVRRQEVIIEMAPPPPKPQPPPEKKAEPEPPPPPKPQVRKAAPRVVPLLRPAAEPAQPAKASDLPALPEGDDPALASASGQGDGQGGPPEPALAPPEPPPPPPPPPPLPVVAAHEGANYRSNPRPVYPELAERKGWEGEVLLAVQVGPDGRPRAVSVKRSSGHDVLDAAAVEAVRGWAFEPAKQGGQPVAGWVTVPIVYHLQ